MENLISFFKEFAFVPYIEKSRHKVRNEQKWHFAQIANENKNDPFSLSNRDRTFTIRYKTSLSTFFCFQIKKWKLDSGEKWDFGFKWTLIQFKATKRIFQKKKLNLFQAVNFYLWTFTAKKLDKIDMQLNESYMKGFLKAREVRGEEIGDTPIYMKTICYLFLSSRWRSLVFILNFFSTFLLLLSVLKQKHAFWTNFFIDVFS